MRKILWLLFVLLVACQTTPSDDTHSVQQSSPERRSAEIIASDKTIEQTAREELSDDTELLSLTHVNVNAYNGLALVTGEVSNTALKNKVLDIVRVIPHVKMVRDSLTLAPPSDAASRANDVRLTEQVKTALTQIHTVSNFDSAMVKVVTENSVVYLLGLVTKEEGGVVVNVTRLQSGVKQIVTAFQYTN